MGQPAQLSQFAIASIYRSVLTEAFRSARALEPNDTEHAAAIERAFVRSIPTTLPTALEDQADSPKLRRALRLAAMRLLVDVCLQIPVPRGPFVAAVAFFGQERLPS